MGGGGSLEECYVLKQTKLKEKLIDFFFVKYIVIYTFLINH